MPYTIKPLLMGKLLVSKAHMTYFLDYDKEIWTAQVAWLLEGGSKRILVDSGISAQAMQRYAFGRPYESIASFEETLSAAGITPEDIDLVIQTHLHYDHCGHTQRCSRATVIVQEEELRFAFSPHAAFAGSYNLDYLKDLRFRLVSGDKEVLPGIKVHLVPGHSPGTQAVAVETDQGTAVISGMCCIKDNLFPPEKMRTKWPVITPGVHCNSLQAFDSLLKVKSLGEIVIPVHDMEYALKKHIP